MFFFFQVKHIDVFTLCASICFIKKKIWCYASVDFLFLFRLFYVLWMNRTPLIHPQRFKLILKFCFFLLAIRIKRSVFFSIFDPYRLTYHVMWIIAIPEDSPEKMQKKNIQKNRQGKEIVQKWCRFLSAIIHISVQDFLAHKLNVARSFGISTFDFVLP